MATLYSSASYTQQLEQAVRDGLATKVPLTTNDYSIRSIRLEFNLTGDHFNTTPSS